MLPHRPFTASLQHLPSLANPMITGVDHQVNKEMLGPTGSGPSHKKNNLAKLQGYFLEKILTDWLNHIVPVHIPFHLLMAGAEAHHHDFGAIGP